MFLVKPDENQVKISVVIKVFSNQQILVTITDSDRFGSTFSAKKVQLEAMGAGGFDMFDAGGQMMMGGMEDEFDDEEGNE